MWKKPVLDLIEGSNLSFYRKGAEFAKKDSFSPQSLPPA